MSSRSRGLVLISAGAVQTLVALAADVPLVGVGVVAAGVRDLRR